MVDRQLALYPPIASKPALSPRQLRVSNRFGWIHATATPKNKLRKAHPKVAPCAIEQKGMGQVAAGGKHFQRRFGRSKRTRAFLDIQTI